MAGVLILIGWRFRIKPPGLFALYVVLLHLRPHVRGARCASTRRTTSSASGSTSGSRSSSSSPRSAFFVWWQFFRESGDQPSVGAGRASAQGPDDGGAEGPRPPAPLASARARPGARARPRRVRGAVRPAAHARPPRGARAAGRGRRRRRPRPSSSGWPNGSELDLDACGEFLVLVGALLELKARELFPEEEVDLADLDPEEAAEELARRLEEFRRIKEAAGWLRRAPRAASATASSGSARRRSRRSPSRGSRRSSRRRSPPRSARSRSSRRTVSVAHMGLRFPPVVAVPRALPGAARAGGGASTSSRRSAG